LELEVPIFTLNNNFTFPNESWNDCDTYWLNKSPQGSDEWNKQHKNRLTSRNFAAAIGKSKFTTPSQVANNISNHSYLIFDDTLLQQHGILIEPEVRGWYSSTRNIIVEEVGLAVPKWEPRIGTSIDGNIPNGMIEIKSPNEMYKSLKEHISKIDNGWIPPKYYHSHIWESHYIQMQGSMAIMNKKWCDYIVYATYSNLAYVERVLFNPLYWNNFLWPGIQNFLNTYFNPSNS